MGEVPNSTSETGVYESESGISRRQNIRIPFPSKGLAVQLKVCISLNINHLDLLNICTPKKRHIIFAAASQRGGMSKKKLT